MGKLQPITQQSPRAALRAASNTPSEHTSKVMFTNTFKYSDTNSRRGNLLGVLRPYWLKVKESERRLWWLKTMVRFELVVRDLDAYAKAESEKLRSEEMKLNPH